MSSNERKVVTTWRMDTYSLDPDFRPKDKRPVRFLFLRYDDIVYGEVVGCFSGTSGIGSTDCAPTS